MDIDIDQKPPTPDDAVSDVVLVSSKCSGVWGGVDGAGNLCCVGCCVELFSA